LSFLKTYTNCLLWLYSTDWLKLWSAVDNNDLGIVPMIDFYRNYRMDEWER
jgi:hypothetical protein